MTTSIPSGHHIQSRSKQQSTRTSSLVAFCKWNAIWEAIDPACLQLPKKAQYFYINVPCKLRETFEHCVNSWNKAQLTIGCVCSVNLFASSVELSFKSLSLMKKAHHNWREGSNKLAPRKLFSLCSVVIHSTAAVVFFFSEKCLYYSGSLRHN